MLQIRGKQKKSLINAQPVAYNVEKVVEQLEYLRFAFNNDECEPATDFR